MEIDPNSDGNQTMRDYLFAIREKDGDSKPIMGVKSNGKATFSGDVTTNELIANGGTIGNWKIQGGNLLGYKNTNILK